MNSKDRKNKEILRTERKWNCRKKNKKGVDGRKEKKRRKEGKAMEVNIKCV